jgi:hypothetical protein
MIPALTEFDPYAIRWQGETINDIRNQYDYTKGTHELLLSGSVGSAKSAFMAHVGITHCLFFEKAKCLVTRRSRPDLEETLWRELLDHIEGCLTEGHDYEVNNAKMKISFSNGSEVITRTFADGRYKKFRSLILSMALIEELTENDDMEFYKEIRMRVGRAVHVPEHLIIAATNPADPLHPAYKYFIKSKNPLRHVKYSITSDNPFLPSSYIEGLKESMSPREARRMLEGEWLELSRDVIYYNYSNEKNFRDYRKEIDPKYPIDLMFDFNIAANKPMSSAVGQHIDGEYHILKTFIIDGARTLDIMEEMDNYGIFGHKCLYRVFGDATGNARDTRSKKSDYDIIEDYLKNIVRYQMKVPASNPPVRKRHNLMNALFENGKRVTRFYVYKDAEEADEGFRLSKLLPKSNYVEDDTFRYQHITTSCGYYCSFLESLGSRRSRTIQL